MHMNYSRFRVRRVSHLTPFIMEFVAITFLALLFSAFFLAGDNSLSLSNLYPRFRLDAVEHERLSGILIPVQIGLGLSNRAPSIGHLPAWNPYLGSGTPLINNGFFYLFNPFMSLPVLLLGGVQGTKLAIIIGLVMAGYSMWFLGRAVGLGALARVSGAVLYLMNGGFVGKMAGGHFQLGLSLVWPPLVFAGLLWTLKTRRRAAPILMAAAFALLFFSGNIYFTLHVLLCCAVISAAYLIHRQEQRWHLDLEGLKRLGLGGLLALGLVMIQFLPLWMVRDYVGHEAVSFDNDSGQLSEQVDMSLSLANFIVPWESWKQFSTPPVSEFSQVSYSYIGPAVFLLIGLLALFVPREGLQRYGKIIWIALLLALLMMIWGAGQTFVVNELYRSIPLLAQFRFIGRANAIAALWWILLAGIALDALWRRTRKMPGLPAGFGAQDRHRLLLALTVPVGLWLWFLWYSSANNSTRLTLSLNNLYLFNALDERRFSSYPQAMNVLLYGIILAWLIDSALFIVPRIRRSVHLWAILSARVLRFGLFLLALAAIFDLMQVNSGLMQFKMPETNFGSLYAYALSAEAQNNPFPSIEEPYTPSTYDGYYSRIRSWGLNEGWIPYPQAGDLIPKNAPRVLNFPDWAIVTSELGQGAIYHLSSQFVDSNRHVLARCVSKVVSGDAPCDLQNQAASALYQLPDALPYAFMASETALKSSADSITNETARPAEVLSHQLDTITIQADSTVPREYLVVQETNFPGWQAWIDDVPASVITIGNQIPVGPQNGFIGIPMQPGTHRYTLRYFAPGFDAGLLISAASLILMLLYLFGRRVRRTQKEAVDATAPENPASNAA